MTRTIAIAASLVLRITGVTQVVLGLLLWSGRALNLLQLHMVIGGLFVLSLLAVAGAALRAGPWRGLPLLALALGLIIPAFGMAQMQILPGPGHWVVRLAHLLLGVAGMIVAAPLERQARGSHASIKASPADGEPGARRAA